MFYIYIYYIPIINIYLYIVWTHGIDWQNLGRRLMYLLLDVKSRTHNQGWDAASEASCGVRRTRKRNSKLCLLFQVGRFVLVVKLWWHIIKSIDYGFHYWHIYNDYKIKKDSLCWLSLDVTVFHLCTFHKVMKVIVSRTILV